MENNDILKGLETIDAKIEDVISDNKASKSAIEAEIKRIGDEQVKLAKALADTAQKSVEVPAETASPSLGQAFTKSAAFENFSNNRKALFTFEKKADTNAATSDYGNIPAYRKPGMVVSPEAPLIIENLFPHVPVTSNSVEYVKEGSFTNNAALVAEKNDKPESVFGATSLATAKIVTIAHWTRITNQLAADAPALAAYIEQKMQYGLQARVDSQLVTGTGGSTELEGLLHAGNYNDPVRGKQIVAKNFAADSTLFDFVLKNKAELEGRYITPEVILLNPSDWTKLAMLKDGQKRYILGGPQSVATKSLWGIPVVTSASVTAGKYILGNISLGATVYDRQALNVAMSDSDNVNFTQNLITIRVERRLGVAYEMPQAINGGDFAIPATA